MSDEMQARVSVTETVEIEFSEMLIRRLLLNHVRLIRGDEDVTDEQITIQYRVDDDQAVTGATLRYQRRADP